MKALKGAFAAVLSLIFVFSLAGCHKQGEIAITAGDYNVTSAMYSYQLVLADSEAKNLIDTSEDYDTTAAGFSYYKQTIDGKTYSDYVKDLALNNCLTAVAYEKLCTEAGLELDEETVSSAESQAYYYWYYYGYSTIFEANGVGYETYVQAMENAAYADLYFNYLYGQDGEKAVSDAELQTALDENYAAVYMLSMDYSSDTEADADELTAQFNAYKERLEAGESFADIYVEYNGSDLEDSTEEVHAQDKYISVVGSEDTSVAFDYFDEVVDLEQNEIAVLSDADNQIIYLVVKKDINADSYYRDEYLKSDILYMLKYEEFEEDMKTYAAELEYTVSSFAINQFKVKNIYDGSDS